MPSNGDSGRTLTSRRLKKGKRRKASSRKWLERQLRDPYVAKAKAEGFRSRAAYKLIEIDKKYGVLKPGMRIVDLGAAPGGWSQVAAQKVGSSSEDPRVIAIDYLGMDPVAGVAILEQDFLTDTALNALKAALGGHRADLIMSDMAAPTTGHKATDHLKIVALCEAAADFAMDVLKPGGALLAKVFQGGADQVLLDSLKRTFDTVRHVKPPASRGGSAELYLLATGFRGAGTD